MGEVNIEDKVKPLTVEQIETIEKFRNKRIVGFEEIAQAKQLQQQYADKITTVKQLDNRVAIQKTVGIEISEDKMVTVKTIGDIVQVSYTKRVVQEMPIERINDDEYRIKATGEVRRYNRSKTRDEQKKSVRRTFKELRNLLNHNFNGSKGEYFITITYRENMTDTKRLLKDVGTFMRYLKRKGFKFDYINAVEPQARGAWHCHIMFKFYDLPNDYLDFDKVRMCWKHGYCYIKQLKNVDNIGAYLSAYLCDIEVDSQTVLDNELDGVDVVKSINYVEVTDENGDKQTKAFIKGGRLRYYPTGMKLYRCSRGIKKPTIEKMTKREFNEEYLNVYDLTYSSKIEVIQDKRLINSVEREVFKYKKSLTQTPIRS